EDDAGRAGRQRRPREGGRERGAAATAVREAHAQRAVAEAMLGAQRRRPRSRVGLRAVEIAGVARDRTELASEPVLGQRVEDLRVAVDPDALVAVAHELD